MKNFSEMIHLTSRQVIDIVMLILLIIFIGQNIESVRVKFLFFGFKMPLIILILVAFFVGYYTSQSFSKKKKKGTDEIGEDL